MSYTIEAENSVRDVLERIEELENPSELTVELADCLRSMSDALRELNKDVIEKHNRISQLEIEMTDVKESVLQVNNNLTQFIEHATAKYVERHPGAVDHRRERIEPAYLDPHWLDNSFPKIL